MDQIPVIIILIAFPIISDKLNSFKQDLIHLIVIRQINMNRFVAFLCPFILIICAEGVADKLPSLNIGITL